jgi:hypothetical protein
MLLYLLPSWSSMLVIHGMSCSLQQGQLLAHRELQLLPTPLLWNPAWWTGMQRPIVTRSAHDSAAGADACMSLEGNNILHSPPVCWAGM